jgi:hypothetical protein
MLEYALIFMVASAHPAPGRGRYDRQASASERARAARAGILEAVREALSRDGDEPSVADVISLTRIGRNTFYGHFEDMEQAMREVSQACSLEIEAALVRSVPRGGTPHAALHGFATTWFEFVDGTPSALLVACRVDREGVRVRLEGALRELHGLGANAGVFRRVLEPERASTLSVILTEASLAIARRRGRPEVWSALFVDAVLALCR